MRKVLIVSLAALLYAAYALAATDGAPVYIPNEIQMLRLQLAQSKAHTAQQAANMAQQVLSFRLAELEGEAVKVKLENKWPETVQFDRDNLGFREKVIQ